MIVTLFLSLPLGRFAYNLRQAREQDAAVSAIKTLGGDVGVAGADPFGDPDPVWCHGFGTCWETTSSIPSRW